MIYRHCFQVRASLARPLTAGPHHLAVSYEAPFAPHVRPHWRVFSSE